MSVDGNSSNEEVIEDSDEEFLMSMFSNDEEKDKEEREMETNVTQSSRASSSSKTKPMQSSQSTWNNIKEKKPQSNHNPYSFDKKDIVGENFDHRPTKRVKHDNFSREEHRKKRKRDDDLREPYSGIRVKNRLISIADMNGICEVNVYLLALNSFRVVSF